MYDGNGMKLMREFYKNYNMVNFPCGNTGAQMGGWFRKEINTLDDLQGVKMRIGGFGGKVLSAIGGVPQNIPAGEIYPALEKGTIDATEWVGPYDDEKLGFFKVAKNYYYPGWWEGGPQLSVYVNTKAYDALPADYKAAIEAAASHAQGTVLKAMPRPVMEAAFKAANEVYADLASKNANWKKVYEDWSKFRADQVLWFRICEREFDNFMAAQRF